MRSHPVIRPERKRKDEKNDFYTPFSVRAEQMRELHRKGLKKGYTHFNGWDRHGYDNLHPDVIPPHKEAGGAEGMRTPG